MERSRRKDEKKKGRDSSIFCGSREEGKKNNYFCILFFWFNDEIMNLKNYSSVENQSFIMHSKISPTNAT